MALSSCSIFFLFAPFPGCVTVRGPCATRVQAREGWGGRRSRTLQTSAERQAAREWQTDCFGGGIAKEIAQLQKVPHQHWPHWRGAVRKDSRQACARLLRIPAGDVGGPGAGVQQGEESHECSPGSIPTTRDHNEPCGTEGIGVVRFLALPAAHRAAWAARRC